MQNWSDPEIKRSNNFLNNMAVKKTNTAKLGLFVMAGLGFLVLLLYIIGKNQNLFGNTFTLKATFANANGLLPGNNVRFAGIDAGGVKSVEVINDTTVEVTMLVKEKMKRFIRKNVHVSIVTDGLIGNMVVNLEPDSQPAPLVDEGEIMRGEKSSNTEEMLKVLGNTTNDVAVIASELKLTLQRFNNSKVVWKLLEDSSLSWDVKQSLTKVKAASTRLDQTMQDLTFVADDVKAIVQDVKNGNGTVGKLFRDSAIAVTAEEALKKFKTVGERADSLFVQINALTASIGYDINNGKGAVNVLLKDEDMAQRLGTTLRNIEQDTESLKEVLTALKNSFLFRGYFRKLEKQKTAQDKPLKY
jgi:phospholipid/cholesterol/gamma-HCH transport system substrate-binding protein